MSVATSQFRSHPLMGGIVALCAYEFTADVVNETLGADLLPSFRGAIERFSWRRLGRRAVPRWSPQGTVIALGVVGGAILRARGRSRTR